MVKNIQKVFSISTSDLPISFTLSEASRCHDMMFSSDQLLSRVRLFATPWTAARQAAVYHQLPEPTQTHVYHVGDAIQPSHPLLV